MPQERFCCVKAAKTGMSHRAGTQRISDDVGGDVRVVTGCHRRCKSLMMDASTAGEQLERSSCGGARYYPSNRSSRWFWMIIRVLCSLGDAYQPL